jgi:hypothetical protein
MSAIVFLLSSGLGVSTSSGQPCARGRVVGGRLIEAPGGGEQARDAVLDRGRGSGDLAQRAVGGGAEFRSDARGTEQRGRANRCRGCGSRADHRRVANHRAESGSFAGQIGHLVCPERFRCCLGNGNYGRMTPGV